MSTILPTYTRNCLHFRGDIPCAPHKAHGVHCDSCQHFAESTGKILIIKLGALGDVIRTTPLLHRLREMYPTKAIWWVTYSPEVLPAMYVHKKLSLNIESALTVQATHFDVVINLDKDPQACALATLCTADEKFGFVLEDGIPAPYNQLAEHKFLTGLFDDVNQANTKSYVEEIFEICGWTFNGEEYILDVPTHNPFSEKRDGRVFVGLNTGCGDRWTSRRWKTEQWQELIAVLKQRGYTPLLLGGKQEHSLNEHLMVHCGAEYFGYHPFSDFVCEVAICDVIVSAVTMAMHVAIALKKPLVLMNNIFNPNEFELFGRGEIVQPTKSCHCFFKGTCTNNEYHCMDYITPSMVADAVQRSVEISQSVSATS